MIEEEDAMTDDQESLQKVQSGSNQKVLGSGKHRAFSSGSNILSYPNPMSLDVDAEVGSEKSQLKKSCCCKLTWSEMARPLVFSALLFVAAALLALGICEALASHTLQCRDILGSYKGPLHVSDSVVAANINKTLNIVLFGDSLINSPYLNNNLVGKMQGYLPNIKLNIQNYGVDGDHIDQMAARLNDMLDNTA